MFIEFNFLKYIYKKKREFRAGSIKNKYFNLNKFGSSQFTLAIKLLN